MSKELEHLVNPTWLRQIQGLQRQARFASLAFHESEAMRSFRVLSESTKLASSILSQLELMKSAQAITKISKLASLAFRESEAMKSIKENAESSRFSAPSFRELVAIKSLRAATKSARLSSILDQQSETAMQLQSMVKTSQFASNSLSQSEAFKQISQFSNLASFKALAKLRNSPFSGISSAIFVGQMDGELVIDESLLDIDSQIREEISSETDFNALSEKTKNILNYLYHYYVLPILLILFMEYVMTNADVAKKELEPISTKMEVKTFSRSSSSRFDRSVLKGFRITSIDSLNFREEPDMRSEVIATLPIGTLVEVIDKTDRSWLLVEVEIDDGHEQGWVARRHTTYFK